MPSFLTRAQCIPTSRFYSVSYYCIDHTSTIAVFCTQYSARPKPMTIFYWRGEKTTHQCGLWCPWIARDFWTMSPIYGAYHPIDCSLVDVHCGSTTIVRVGGNNTKDLCLQAYLDFFTPWQLYWNSFPTTKYSYMTILKSHFVLLVMVSKH